MNVLFHIDDESRWEMLLGNVRNFLKEIPDAQITVVANGPAVRFYSQSDGIADTLLEQVDFVACRNAMKSNEVYSDTLDDAIRIVKAGVVEIVEKQQAGYAYIKP